MFVGVSERRDLQQCSFWAVRLSCIANGILASGHLHVVTKAACCGCMACVCICGGVYYVCVCVCVKSKDR